jgi:hypothetical protein
VFARAAQTSDIVLATFDDEAALTGDAHPEQTLARYVSYGPAEVVVKLGPKARSSRTAALSPACRPHLWPQWWTPPRLVTPSPGHTSPGVSRGCRQPALRRSAPERPLT